MCFIIGSILSVITIVVGILTLFFSQMHDMGLTIIVSGIVFLLITLYLYEIKETLSKNNELLERLIDKKNPQKPKQISPSTVDNQPKKFSSKVKNFLLEDDDD